MATLLSVGLCLHLEVGGAHTGVQRGDPGGAGLRERGGRHLPSSTARVEAARRWLLERRETCKCKRPTPICMEGFSNLSKTKKLAR